MTIAVANVANTNTFSYWKTRTNELADAMSTKTVTVNSNAATGNAKVNGTFMTNTLIVTDSIRGGSESSNDVITFYSNLAISGSSRLIVGSNVNISASFVQVGTTGNIVVNSTTISVNSVPILQEFVNTQISGNSTQIIDSFAVATFRSGEYQMTIKNNAANGYQVSKLLVIADDGTNPLITDYGLLYTNTQLAQFSANANATHVRVLVTGLMPNASANIQIKAIRQLVVV